MKKSHAKSSKEKEPENLWSVRFDQRLLWDENVCETKCPGMARHRHARRDRRLYTLRSAEATSYITIISQNQPTDQDVKPNHVISFCKTSNIPRAKLLQTSTWRLWEEGLVWAEAFKQPGFCENKNSAAETICLLVPLQMYLYMRWLWNDTLYTTSLAKVEVCHWLKEKEDEDKSTSSRCHLKGHRRWCYPLYLYSGLPDLPIPRYGSPFSALQQFQVHGRSDSRDKIESDAPYQSISAFSITQYKCKQCKYASYETGNLMRHTKAKFTTFRIPETRLRVMLVTNLSQSSQSYPQRSDKGRTTSL